MVSASNYPSVLDSQNKKISLPKIDIMKTKLLIAITAVLVTFFIASCDKNDDDSPIPEKTPEEILTSRSWRLDEIRFLQNNSLTYYKRGVTDDPYSFDTESIKFNVDRTGTYIAGGITYNLTWEFNDLEKSKIKFIINYATPLTVNWENIIYSDSSLKYSEYYNRTGTNTLSVATRIP